MLPRGVPFLFRSRPARWAPFFLVRKRHWKAFFGLPTTNSIDVDAFTVDPATGDIYVSFDGTTPSSATAIAGASCANAPGAPAVASTILRGDVIRIPAAAYTPSGPFGVVTAPLPGLAERVINAAEVTTLVATAGGTFSVSPVNTFALDIDPNGGVYANAANSFVMPNLLFTVDSSGGATTGTQNLSACSVYSTAGSGSFAVINGVTLNQPTALGIRNVSFNPGFFAGALDALDVVTHTPSLDPFASRPLHLDAFPTSGIISGANPASWNVNLTGHISGAAPGSLLGIFGAIVLVPSGGFVPRWNVSVFGVAGYPDLYVDPFGFASPTCQLSPPVPPFDLFCQTGANALLS